MDREGFRNRLKQYKLAREENPGLKYWEWKAQPAKKDIPKYYEGGGVKNFNLLRYKLNLPSVSTEDFPIVYDEKLDLENKIKLHEKVVNEFKLKKSNIVLKFNDTADLYDIPKIKDKEITLSNAGSMTGAVLSTNLLDSIYKYANITDLPLIEAIGLPAQETAFGNWRNVGGYAWHNAPNDRDTRPDLITSDWLYTKPGVLHYIDMQRLNAGYNASEKESIELLWDDAKNADRRQLLRLRDKEAYLKGLADYLKSKQKDIDKIFENFKIIPPLQHAYEYYKTGNYNKGDSSHKQDVIRKGEEVMRSPEFKKWAKQNNIKYAEGGEVRDNTHVAPIEKEQVFIPATGELKRKQELLNKLSRNGQIKSGAIDVVSPEFDLLTLGRGLFTKVLTPKGNITNLPINDDSYYRMITDLFYGKSKRVGAINDIFNSNTVRTKNSVFRSPMFSKGKPYYNPDDYNNAYYIVSNNKKGLNWSTVDNLGNPNNNPQGIAFTPLYNGKPNIAPKDYFNIYKYLGDGKYQQIISNLKVVPITGLNLISENVEEYADGGEVIDSRQKVLDKANKVASNYSDAKDFDLNPFVYAIRKFAKNTIGKGGISNCTLSATGWVDPNNQYMSAKNIFDNAGSGYTEIDKAYALPGDLLIAKNPKEGSYHTMLIEGFDGDIPLLRYSKGGHNTKKNLVTNRSLEEYHKLDNEQGGNHTEDHYFRYSFPNEFWLPEVVITPEKYSDGGEVGDATQYGEPDDLLLPEVRQKVNLAKALRGEVNQFLDDWNSARFATGRFDSQLGNGLMESQKESRDSAPLLASLSGYGAVSAFRKTPVFGIKGDTSEQVTTRFLENVKSTASGMTHKIKTSLNTSTPIRGEFDQASHTIYYDRNSPFTKTHEQTHASGATPQENIVGEIIDQSGKYNNPYQDDKKEIYARLMQLREANDIDPTVVWDKKMLKEFKKNAQDFNILNRYDDDIILDLFNNVADAGNIQNNHPYQIQFAAEGGIIGNPTIKRKIIKKKKRKM